MRNWREVGAWHLFIKLTSGKMETIVEKTLSFARNDDTVVSRTDTDNKRGMLHHEQGDQIGRIFAYWAIIGQYFGHFGEN
jgi:hypothetical protein